MQRRPADSRPIVRPILRRWPPKGQSLPTRLGAPGHGRLSGNYLKPLGISSLLDAPVWMRGEVVGVLCHEHIGPVRHWSAEEIDFVSSLGATVSLALEESNRARSEQLLRESEARLRESEERFSRPFAPARTHDDCRV